MGDGMVEGIAGGGACAGVSGSDGIDHHYLLMGLVMTRWWVMEGCGGGVGLNPWGWYRW